MKENLEQNPKFTDKRDNIPGHEGNKTKTRSILGNQHKRDTFNLEEY